MKDKPPGFTGKKIDNYVQIQQKSTAKADSSVKSTADLKKLKKKNVQVLDKGDKQKLFETPNKQRHSEYTKLHKKQVNQKTPDRMSIQRREDRSKSTNQKLVKRKSAKSVENLRVIKNYKKTVSPVSSGQKSRSHSKSSKKLLKSSQSSLKNIFMFSNSGIKNKINKGNNDQVKKYMQQKKKKQKIQKLKQSKIQKQKKQKLKDQLKKVQQERKANASKPYQPYKKLIYQKQERLPIYFDDQDIDDDSGYDQLKKEAEKLIHDSPTPKSNIETIPISKPKGNQKHQTSSGKKLNKKIRNIRLVNLYISGNINEKQLNELNYHIIKIQSIWRGYYARKVFSKKLNDQSTKIRYIKNRIQNKKGLWNDQQNSIIKIQKDSQIKIRDEDSQEHYINYNSNGASNISNFSQSSMNSRLISNKGDRYKKLSIQLEEEANISAQQKIEKQHNIKMLKQIEQLKKMLQTQNQKYKYLEEQNINLKRNLEVMSIKEHESKDEDLINSKDFIEIRMPKKIQSPQQPVHSQRKKEQIKNLGINNIINLNFSPQKERPRDLDVLKKQFEAFECSSPSNAVLEEQLKSLKNKNIQGLFKKKQITIQQKYQKKNQMFKKMLSDSLFSPRTYNIRKKQLDNNYSTEISEINNRKQEAKRVVGFISDISGEQQANSLRMASIGSKQEELTLNFKKEKNVSVKQMIDSFTNTSPFFKKETQFKAPSNKSKKFDIQKQQNSSYSSQEDKVYKKYWTDDVQELHDYAMDKIQKIDEALRARESKDSSDSSQYNSQGSSKQKNFQVHKKIHVHSKSGDFQVNLASLKESYQDYLEQEIPSQNQRKAKQIFNKIDINECKSEEQLQNSNDNICKLLNTRVFQGPSTHNQVKQVQNLYISEADFNIKKRKQEQLSRSSSFEKSNKSLSINNSQVQTKGFITNLTFIKQFCISVCEYIRNVNTYKQSFIDNISQSIKFDFVEFLKAFRITLGGSIKNNYNTYTDQYLYHYFKIVSSKNQAISHDLFSSFMKAYQQDKSNDLEWNKSYFTKEIKEIRQYFLISIVDCFNQSLQFQKPGSIYGQPFPWMNNINRLKNYSHSKLKFDSISSINDSQQQTQQDKKLDQIFGSSIAKIIQWGSFLCGFIADSGPMEMGDSQIANLTDQQLNSIRQNRIGLMLQKWLLQQQQNITNSTNQYTQVLLNLSEKIIETLLLQCTEDLQQITIN